MAESIGFAIIAAATASTATASVVGAYAVAGVTLSTIVGTTALIGGSLLLQSLTAQKPQRPEQQQSVLNEAIGARKIAYGRTIVGGNRFLFETKNGGLMQGIVVSARRIDAFEKFLIGDRYAVVASVGPNKFQVKDFPQINVVYFETHLGEDDQLASDYLLEQFGPSAGGTPIWSNAHRLRGVAYAAVQFTGVKREEQQIVYPQGYATPLRFLIRGARVWDPTNAAMDPDNPAAWAWSENAGDCILDYLRAKDGLRFARTRLDIASFQDFHATCAETVTRKDGSTEPRYRLGGTYALNEAPKDVLARMTATCDGHLVRGPSGLIGIRGGKYVAPLVNIPTSQIVTASLTQGNDRLDAYNRLSVSYSDPDAYYQPTQLQAREDLISQSRVGVVDETFDLVMVPSWTQAARLAKIKFAKDNPAWKGTLGTNLAALNALGEETVGITYDPLGDDDVGAMMDTVASVNAFGLRADMTGCDLQFSSISADAYAWNAATEEPPRPALPNYTPPLNEVATPTGANVTASRRTVSGGATAVWGVLAWNPSTRTDAVPQAQYRLVGSGEAGWQGMTLRSDNQSAEAGPLTDGNTYDFRVRFVAGSTPSNWTTPVTLAVTADNVPPAAPTYTSASRSGSSVTHTFRQSTSANAASVRLSRAAGAGKVLADAATVFSEALGPNVSDTYVGTLPDLGFYQWWLEALNGSGVKSPAAGPLSLYWLRLATNLLTSGDDFTAAAWVKSNLTATANAVASPDASEGAIADALMETSATGAHSAQQNNVAITAGAVCRFTCAFKANGRSSVLMQLVDPANAVNRVNATFNLTTGGVSFVVGGTGSQPAAAGFGGAGGAVDLGGGWWLCSMRGTIGTLTAINARIILVEGGATSYAGDTTKGVYAVAAGLAQ